MTHTRNPFAKPAKAHARNPFAQPAVSDVDLIDLVEGQRVEIHCAQGHFRNGRYIFADDDPTWVHEGIWAGWVSQYEVVVQKEERGKTEMVHVITAYIRKVMAYAL